MRVLTQRCRVCCLTICPTGPVVFVSRTDERARGSRRVTSWHCSLAKRLSPREEKRTTRHTERDIAIHRSSAAGRRRRGAQPPSRL